MAATHSHEITQLLHDWNQGNEAALGQLVPLVESELHRLAKLYTSKERAGQSLQATELVNEAYIRLIDWQNVDWQNRAHFIAMAAGVMRRVLVDRFRKRHSGKRSGNFVRVSLPGAASDPKQFDPDLMMLNDALDELARLDQRQSQIVELKFFGGLTEQEIAHVLGISDRQVRRDWKVARDWLYLQLNKQ
jgi:RNA polymerase sigma factor (TIGR02999 family)